MTSVYMLCLLLLPLSIGRQPVLVSATVTAVSEPSVSAVISVTAITGLQLTGLCALILFIQTLALYKSFTYLLRLQHHFRLQQKPEKLVSVRL